MAPPAPKKRIGELLLEAGIIDDTQLRAALGHQRQWGVRLGQALVDLKLATEADIVRALSLKFGFEVAKMDGLEPYGFEQALKLLPREFTTRNNVFPMWADTANLTVAMSDPTNLAVVDEIRFRTSRRVKVCVGGDREIASAVKRHYPAAGAVEAIALDLEADGGVEGEAIYDPFGGGSKDALDAFFGETAVADTVPQASQGPALPRAAPAGPAQPAAAARRASAAPQAPSPSAVAPAQRPAQRPAQTSPQRPASPAAAAPRGPAPAPAGPRPPPAQAGAERLAARAPASPGRASPAAAQVRAPSAKPPTHPPFALELEETTGEAPIPAAVLSSLAEVPPATEEGGSPSRQLTAHEIAILDSLDKLANGAPAQPDVVKPTQAMAAMIRLLIRRRIVTELEFLDELSKK